MVTTENTNNLRVKKRNPESYSLDTVILNMIQHIFTFILPWVFSINAIKIVCKK